MNIHGLKLEGKRTTQTLKRYLKLNKRDQSKATIGNLRDKIKRLSKEVRSRKKIRDGRKKK